MFRQIKTFALDGINAYTVNVEVDISRGLPSFGIIGLPDASVKEAKDRLHSALVNSGFQFPSKKILINLAPEIGRAHV